MLPAMTALESGLPEAAWVGLDDLDVLSAADRAQVLGLVSTARGTTVALASRMPLTPAARALLRGPVFERGPADLALDAYAVALCLARDHGVTDPEVAVHVAGLTAGWPTLVHFAGDALERDPRVDVRAYLGAPDGPAAHWLNTEVLSALTASQRRMLRILAGLGPVTQLLCDRLDRAGDAPSGTGEVDGLVDLLGALGLLVPVRRLTETELVLVPAVALLVAGVDQTSPAPSLSDEQRWSVAADVHTAQGAWLPAAQAHARRGDDGSVAAIIVEQGENLLRRGDAAGIVSLAGALITSSSLEVTGRTDPLPERSTLLLQRTYAEALRRSGEVAASRRAFASLVERAERVGWDAGLAARVAQLHYTKGEFACALVVLDAAIGEPVPQNKVGAASEGATSPGPPNGTSVVADTVEDEVDRLACRVHVLAMLGRPSEAAPVADRVLALAEADGGDRVLGVAHLAAARLARGARKEAHHDQALLAATRANDLATAARVLGAQTHLLLAQARYAEAGAGAREAARLAELSSPLVCVPPPCTTWPRPSTARATIPRRGGTCSAQWRSVDGWARPGWRWAWSGWVTSTVSWGTTSRLGRPMSRPPSWRAARATHRCSSRRSREWRVSKPSWPPPRTGAKGPPAPGPRWAKSPTDGWPPRRPGVLPGRDPCPWR